jgi:hypothetical protein
MRVSSLQVFVEPGIGLPTGTHCGSCPDRASISLIKVRRKYLKFSSHHMKIKELAVDNGQI